ncbi:MAG: hypothetical protein ABIE23_01860 [archaeon]
MKKIIILAGVFALMAFVLLDTGHMGGVLKGADSGKLKGAESGTVLMLKVGGNPPTPQAGYPEEPMLYPSPGQDPEPDPDSDVHLGIHVGGMKEIDGMMFQPAEGGDRPRNLEPDDDPNYTHESAMLKDVVGLKKPSVISFMFVIGTPMLEEIWI